VPLQRGVVEDCAELAAETRRFTFTFRSNPELVGLTTRPDEECYTLIPRLGTQKPKIRDELAEKRPATGTGVLQKLNNTWPNSRCANPHADKCNLGKAIKRAHPFS
jgi:hypothetical protein